MNTIYLVRHSITEGVERRLYYGATDLPLTPAGEELCLSMRGSFALPKSVVFATSGMLRTEQTLKGLFGDVPHEVLPGMREMNVGILEMHSYDELKDNKEYITWLFDEVGDVRIPGGETKLEMSERVMACIHDLMQRPEPAMLVVCHGGTICNTMFHLFRSDAESFYDWSVQPCHGYAIACKDGKAVSWERI